MHKLESVLSNLKAHFGQEVKFRELAGVIRFNVESLNDSQVVNLGILSVQLACEIQIKRSGTGLLIIVTL